MNASFVIVHSESTGTRCHARSMLLRPLFMIVPIPRYNPQARGSAACRSCRARRNLRPDPDALHVIAAFWIARRRNVQGDALADPGLNVVSIECGDGFGVRFVRD